MDITRIVLFLSMISLFACKTVQLIKSTDDKSIVELTAGKCYINCAILSPERPAEKRNPFLIEHIYPEFKKVKTKYTIADLKKYELDENRFQLPIKQDFYYFELHNNLNPKVGCADSTLYLNYEFCYKYNEKEYSTFTLEELNEMKMTVDEEVVLKEAYIRIVDMKRKPKEIKRNQLYFESHTWTEIREAIIPVICYSLYSPRQVEQKLQLLGYEAVVDNLIDELEKAAIKDFQKKNGLKEGEITKETLRALGLIE